MGSYVSIIVPVYNQEKYLVKCIESILNQSYKYFELLLVDDGSTDTSLEICNKYRLKDKRIKVISQKNQGVSVARNNALVEAVGEYIVFIDSDDYVKKNYIHNLLNSIKLNKVDLVISGYEKRIKLKNREERYEFYMENQTLSKEQFLINIYSYINKMLIQAPWSKIYKANIIKDNNLRFDENLSFGEDTIFVYNYLKYVNSIFVSSTLDYVYMSYNNNSLSSKKTGIKLNIYFYLFKNLEDLLDESNIQKNYIDYILNSLYTDLFFSLYYDIYQFNKNYRRKLINSYVTHEKVIQAFKNNRGKTINSIIVKSLVLGKKIKLIDYCLFYRYKIREIFLFIKDIK